MVYFTNTSSRFGPMTDCWSLNGDFDIHQQTGPFQEKSSFSGRTKTKMNFLCSNSGANGLRRFSQFSYPFQNWQEINFMLTLQRLRLVSPMATSWSCWVTQSTTQKSPRLMSFIFMQSFCFSNFILRKIS